MRQDRRRWLAPLLAALLLITGAVPAAVAAPRGALSASAVGHERPAPDDAIRATAADHGERGGVTERSTHAALVPAGTSAPPATSTDTARPHAHTASPVGSAPHRPRAPPGSASPIPF